MRNLVDYHITRLIASGSRQCSCLQLNAPRVMSHSAACCAAQLPVDSHYPEFPSHVAVGRISRHVVVCT